MTIKNFFARRKYQNLQLTNFTHFTTMVDKKTGGSSSLSDLKVELLNRILNTDESSAIQGGKSSEFNNFSFNGCGGTIPQ